MSWPWLFSLLCKERKVSFIFLLSPCLPHWFLGLFLLIYCMSYLISMSVCSELLIRKVVIVCSIFPNYASSSSTNVQIMHFICSYVLMSIFSWRKNANILFEMVIFLASTWCIIVIIFDQKNLSQLVPTIGLNLELKIFLVFIIVSFLLENFGYYLGLLYKRNYEQIHNLGIIHETEKYCKTNKSIQELTSCVSELVLYQVCFQKLLTMVTFGKMNITSCKFDAICCIIRPWMTNVDSMIKSSFHTKMDIFEVILW